MECTKGISFMVRTFIAEEGPLQKEVEFVVDANDTQ